jgi:hypothetical protein
MDDASHVRSAEAQPADLMVWLRAEEASCPIRARRHGESAGHHGQSQATELGIEQGICWSAPGPIRPPKQ